MRQIEAMIACVAVSGAVLYGPISRELTRMESKAAPMVRAALIDPSRIPPQPQLWAMAKVPPLPAVPQSKVHAICPQEEIARLQQRLDKAQAKVQRDMAKNNARLTHTANLYAREQVQAQMRMASEQLRVAMRHAHSDRAAYTVPNG